MSAVLLAGFTSDVSDSLEITGEALSGVGTTVEVAADVIDTASRGLAVAGESLTGVADSTESVATVADSLAGLTAAEIPETIESVRGALRPLIGTARALDRTLRALSVLGINYDPQTPLSQALQQIDDELAPLASEVRAQSSSLAEVRPTMEQLGTNLAILAGDLTAIETRLTEADRLLSDYRVLTERAQATIGQTTDQLRVRSTLGYLTIALLAVAGMTLSAGMVVLGRQLEAGPFVQRVELVNAQAESDELSISELGDGRL
jgi:methyl-accepting chemotaxis protein